MPDFISLRTALETVVRSAGAMILRRPAFTVTEKEGHANFVTDVDRAVEAYLIAELTSLVPGSRVISEEKDNDSLTDVLTWVIDPVDGTTNMIHDYRCSAVSVALMQDRHPVIGMVFQPYSDELFSAVLGHGTFLNGKPVHVSDTPFEKALIAFGTSPYHPDLAEAGMSLALEFLRSCADIRRSGSAAVDLANVACGRQDVYFELTLKPWDFAAGSLLVTEAGGCFRTLSPDSEGPDWSGDAGVLASNKACFDPACQLLAGSD